MTYDDDRMGRTQRPEAARSVPDREGHVGAPEQVPLRAARIRRCAGRAPFPQHAWHLNRSGAAEAHRRAPRLPRGVCGGVWASWSRRAAFALAWLGAAVAIGVASAGADGPIWYAAESAPRVGAPADTLHAELERAYRPRMTDTRPIILDAATVAAGPEAVAAQLAGRLNADGVYANVHWDDYVAELAQPGLGARAVWRPFLGGPRGQGVAAYLGTTGVCAVVPPDGPPAYARGALSDDADGPGVGLPDAFWRRLVLIHELEHCVDTDRGDAAAHGHGDHDVAAVRPAGRDRGHGTNGGRDRGHGTDGGAEPAVSPRELYADAATALRMLAAGTSMRDMRRFAALRAAAVARPLARGLLPNFSHFTAPMLRRLLDDVAAGRVVPATLDDEAVHALAVTYRDRALAEAEGFRPEQLSAAVAYGERRVDVLLRHVGAGEAWIDSLELLDDRSAVSLAAATRD